MDFIERWFGMSPDGGNGSTELMYLTVLALIVVVLARHRSLRAFVRRILGR
jgi:hypothetical protein